MNYVKQCDTLRARAALSGIALECIEGDHGQSVLIATSGARTKAIRSLEEMALWLDQVGAGLTCVTAGGIDE